MYGPKSLDYDLGSLLGYDNHMGIMTARKWSMSLGLCITSRVPARKWLSVKARFVKPGRLK